MGAGAFRPHPQAPGLQIGQRSAARSDRVDVHHRHQHRQTLQQGRGRAVGLSVRYEADIEAGPSQVYADQVGSVEDFGERRPSGSAAYRAGKQSLQGPLGRRPGGYDAAVGLHDPQRRRHAPASQTRREIGHVAGYRRSDIGVHDR